MAFFLNSSFFTQGPFVFLLWHKMSPGRKTFSSDIFFLQVNEKKKKWKVLSLFCFLVLFVFLFKIFSFTIKLFFHKSFVFIFLLTKTNLTQFYTRNMKNEKIEETFFHQIFLHIVWKKGWKSLKYIFSAKLNVLYLFSHMKKKRVFLSVWVKKIIIILLKAIFV